MLLLDILLNYFYMAALLLRFYIFGLVVIVIAFAFASDLLYRKFSISLLLFLALILFWCKQIHILVILIVVF
jgi:hypothetical protein